MGTPSQPIYLAGATGSGKTAVAIELATRLSPAAIVNADAYQLYRGLEILTAAPTASELEQVPHHLFGTHELMENSDAAAFAEKARSLISRLSRTQTPIVTGGSGLYLKAITHGLAPTPKSDPALREQLDVLPLTELIERYISLDPEGAAATNLKNRRYVTRNLEICLLTGRPASQLKAEWQESAPRIRAYYLDRSREDTYERINRRTLKMFADGVVDEVARHKDFSVTASKAIGLREIRQLIAGEITRDECVAQIQQATRRYAKRQQTWFRRETAFFPIPVAPDDTAGTITGRILEHLGSQSG